jgi:hypothetical protein
MSIACPERSRRVYVSRRAVRSLSWVGTRRCLVRSGSLVGPRCAAATVASAVTSRVGGLRGACTESRPPAGSRRMTGPAECVASVFGGSRFTPACPDSSPGMLPPATSSSAKYPIRPTRPIGPTRSLRPDPCCIRHELKTFLHNAIFPYAGPCLAAEGDKHGESTLAGGESTERERGCCYGRPVR